MFRARVDLEGEGPLAENRVPGLRLDEALDPNHVRDLGSK